MAISRPHHQRLAWWPSWGWPAAAALFGGLVGAGLARSTREYHAANALQAKEGAKEANGAKGANGADEWKAD